MAYHLNTAVWLVRGDCSTVCIHELQITHTHTYVVSLSKHNRAIAKPWNGKQEREQHIINDHWTGLLDSPKLPFLCRTEIDSVYYFAALSLLI